MRVIGNDSGFTLVELLISTIIMSMIVLALTGGQRFAVRAWESQEHQIEREADLGAIQNALRQMLISGREFQGDDSALSWVGALPQGLNRGGLYDIQLKTDEDRLVMVWRPHFKGPAAPVDPTTEVLAKGVQDFDLAYYTAGLIGQAGAGDSPSATITEQWQQSVTDKAKPPALIKISLGLTQGRWQPLIVAPMLDAPLGAAPGAPAGQNPVGPNGPTAPGQSPGQPQANP